METSKIDITDATKTVQWSYMDWSCYLHTIDEYMEALSQRVDFVKPIIDIIKAQIPNHPYVYRKYEVKFNDDDYDRFWQLTSIILEW
jgi:hypothetical protein